jgi:hypothetical protein
MPSGAGSGGAVPASIQPAPDGPYLVSNVPQVTDWLGVTLDPLPQSALCRCGASQIKLQLLCRAADDVGVPKDPEFRAAFVAYREWGSRLAVENSTPGAKPPPHMPVPRWWWVCDAYPWARVSALATDEPDDAEVKMPDPDEELSFDAHIKPLFRQRDRGSMQFAFDLWSYADVAARADDILDRLAAGSMPCDGAWPDERVAVFKRWIDTGKPR